MKLAIFAIVVLALVAVAHSSVIPVLAITGPGGAISVPGSLAVQASVAHGPVAAVAVHSIPHIIAAPVAVAVSPVAAGGATYVAKNRGVVHVAQLDGHTQSAVSLNLQAAPGTA